MIDHILDNPIVRSCESMGYPEEPVDILCPVCGEDCEMLYKDKYGSIVGCESCIEGIDAYCWVENHR